MAAHDPALLNAFFDRFCTAFATFDASPVADLFSTPSVARRGDGSILGLPTRDDVLRYYQAALDSYHRKGCRSCRWKDLQATSMGRGSVVAAVSWELLDRDGAVVQGWRQSYNLGETDQGLKVFASAMHID